MLTRVAGDEYEIDREQVERAMSDVEPEPIQEHYVVVHGRRFPPKQVLAVVTGLDRGDFTTHQARSVLRRLGFGTHRRGDKGSATNGAKAIGATRAPVASGPQHGAEAAALEPYAGRWIAQDGLEVLFDAETPDAVLSWLRRHRRRARVWRVPDSRSAAGSTLSVP